MLINQPHFAKMPPVIIHTPGLFVSRRKGCVERPMELNHLMGKLMFNFSGVQLGPIELRVLQGVIGFAGLQQRTADNGDDKELDNVQRLLHRRVSVHTTYNKLAEVIGYPVNSGSAQKTIRRALEKLASVSISFCLADSLDILDRSAGQLICNQNGMRHIDLELNSVLAAAVQGGRGSYLRLNLLETRQLDSNVTRLLHQRLHWVNAGMSRDVSLEKLIGYVWSADEVSDSALRTRRQEIRRSLVELTALGWTVKLRGDLYQVGRPPLLLLS